MSPWSGCVCFYSLESPEPVLLLGCVLRGQAKPGTSLRPDVAQAVLCDGGLIA